MPNYKKKKKKKTNKLDDNCPSSANTLISGIDTWKLCIAFPLYENPRMKHHSQSRSTSEEPKSQVVTNCFISFSCYEAMLITDCC